MKKKVWIFFILLFAVGCKSTNLTCTKTIIDSEDVKVEEKISLNFKKKKLDKTFYSLDYYYASNIEANAEATKDSLEEQFSDYKDSKGIEYFFSNTDQGIHFELQMNPNKVSDEDKEYFEKQISYKSYADAKDELISDGYQCK